MAKLLVINPNTTQSVTDLVARHIAAAVGDSIEIVPATGRFGCAYISSESCFAIAAHAALDCYAHQGASCDGVLLACFGDPGLFALREICAVPVIGLAEACMQASAHRGKRFSIVTGGARWTPMLERLASSLGLLQSLASVRTTTLTEGQIAAVLSGGWCELKMYSKPLRITLRCLAVPPFRGPQEPRRCMSW